MLRPQGSAIVTILAIILAVVGAPAAHASTCSASSPVSTYVCDGHRQHAQATAAGRGSSLAPPLGVDVPSALIRSMSADEGASVFAAEGVGDDWPVISGIVRDAARSKGNFGLGEGTLSQAERAGQAWVGEGAHWSSGGKALISRDVLRRWRPATFKPDWDNY